MDDPPQQPAPPPPHVYPRVLVVCRRLVRKHKYVNFVGEYHLSLLLSNQAQPVMIPRTPPVSKLLRAYLPIHGILLIEGEDIGEHYQPFASPLSAPQAELVRERHASDTTVDHERDRVEFELVQLALQYHIPILAICRGSQILNVAAGGKLHADIDVGIANAERHIDYANYDAHRHALSIRPNTPLFDWFQRRTISVNSYHHQGIHTLARRFVPMAHSPDGLVEAFYEPQQYDPPNGRFRVGLQFHPERMQDVQRALSDQPARYDYDACVLPYKMFVSAARAFARRQQQQLQLRARTRGVAQRWCARAYGAKLATLVRRAPARRYSKEHVQRIVRCGGTVHGGTFVLRMLREQQQHELLRFNGLNLAGVCASRGARGGGGGGGGGGAL